MYILKNYKYFSSFGAGNTASNDEKYNWNNSAGQGLIIHEPELCTEIFSHYKVWIGLAIIDLKWMKMT